MRRRLGGVGRVLAFCLAVVGFVAGCATTQRFGPDRTLMGSARIDVPIQIDAWGCPEVEAGLKGERPICLIDLGGAAPAVSPGLVTRAQLPRYPYTKMLMRDAGGNRSEEHVVSIDELVLGQGETGVRFLAFDAVERDLSGVTAAGTKRDVVLAAPVFRDVLLTLDFPDRKLVIETGDLPPPDGRDVVAMHAAPGGHLYIEVMVGSRPQWILLDTGFSDGLELTPQIAKAAGRGEVVGVRQAVFYYGQGSSELRRLEANVRIGQHVLEYPVYGTSGNRPPMLGMAYLRHFSITLDQKNGRARFTRPPGYAAPIRVANPVTKALTFRPDNGVVVAIKPAGSAERAGIKVGDQVVAIEGIPFKDVIAGKSPRWVQTPGFLTLQMRRKGGGTYVASIRISEMIGKQRQE